MKKYILITIGVIAVIIITATGFVYQKVGAMLAEEVGEKVSFIQVVHFLTDGTITSKEEESYKRERNSSDLFPVTIYYPDKLSELIPLTTLTIETATQNSEILLGSVNSEPVDLFLLVSDKEMKEVNGKEIDKNTNYNVLLQSIYVVPEDLDNILEDDFTKRAFQSQVSYEYAHYMFREKLKNENIDFNSFPVWFYEGFAEYIANMGSTIDYEMFRVVPFNELVTFSDWSNESSNSSADVSMQSYFAIKYLVSNFGDNILYEIIEETKSTKDFDEAFEIKTGMNLEDLEDNFLTQYKYK